MPKKNILNPITGNFDTIFDQTAAEVPASTHGNISGTDVQAQLEELETEKQSLSEKGVANGYASLDSGGKIPSAQLPNAVMEFKGMWDASTNTPTLADGVGNAGDVYQVSVGGTQDLGAGSQTWAANDLVIYSGTVWEKAPGADAVLSVNGNTGVVSLTTTDIPEGTNEYHTTTRARTAAVVNSLAGSQTDQAPSVQAVNTALSNLNEFEDNAFRVIDQGDNSKKLAFEVSQISTSTIRTVTAGDRDVDLQELIISTDETAETLTDYLSFPLSTTTSVIQGESVSLGGTSAGLQVFGSSDTDDSDGSAGCGLISGAYNGTGGGSLAGSSYVIGGAVTNASSTSLAGDAIVSGGGHLGSSSGDGGGVFIQGGDSVSGSSGSISVTTPSAPDSGGILLSTGAGTAGDSGPVQLLIGTATGSQGEFQFLKSGAAPSIGDVWTATGTNGEGYWATPSSSSGANTSLSNLSAVDIGGEVLAGSGNILPDISGVRDLGTASLLWDRVYATTVWFSDKLQNTTGSFILDPTINFPDSNFGAGMYRNTAGGFVGVFSLDLNSAFSTSNVLLQTGNNTGAGDSGFISIRTGTSVGGSRGNIEIEGGALDVTDVESGKGMPIWKKYTVSHTALQAAALTNDIELFSLPAFGVIQAVIIKHSTSFSGTGITDYSLSVGVTGTLDKYASAFDVAQATGATVGQSTNVLDFESVSGATSIRLAAASVGADLDQSTAGTVDVYILWGTME